MFETSGDILNWVIAVCVAVFTFFLVWGMFYIVQILRRGYSVVKEISDIVVSIKEKIERLEKLFDAIEEKVNNTAAYIPVLIKGVSEVLDFVKRKKDSSDTPKKTKKSKKRNKDT